MERLPAAGWKSFSPGKWNDSGLNRRYGDITLPKLSIHINRFITGQDPLVLMVLIAAIVGFISSCTVELFRFVLYAIVRLYSGQEHLVDAARVFPPLLRALIPMLGGVGCGFLMCIGQNRVRWPRGPEYMEAVRVGDGLLPIGPNLVRTVSSLVGVSGGITIGREGTMIQFATVISSLFGRFGSMDASQRRLIVACGAAAGFACAYHAPIAGTLFVAEIILGNLALRQIAPILIAAVIGELTTQSFFASGPLYLAHAITAVGFPDLFDACLIGLIAGFLGPGFLYLLEKTHKVYQERVHSLPLRMGLAGLGIGLLSVVRPEVWGNGYSVVQSFLASDWSLWAVVSVFAVRLLGVTFASAAGIPGGVLTPTLLLGAAMGLFVGHSMLIPAADHSQNLWILVGMGSLLAATTHAPAMSAIMMFEITHNYSIVLATMPACVIASVLGKKLRAKSVYADALGLALYGNAAPPEKVNCK
jgi:chloride channel protein, CIC family